MVVAAFPSVENANQDGLLAIGGDLEVESLLLAYTNGIFPWPIEENFPLTWFAPDPRGVLEYQNLISSLPNSLKKFLRKAHRYYTVMFNANFEAVIKGCALAKRESDSKTWITDSMIKAYIDLNKAGYAFSVEVYESSVVTKIDISQEPGSVGSGSVGSGSVKGTTANLSNIFIDTKTSIFKSRSTLELPENKDFPIGQLVGGLYGVHVGNYFSGESMFHLRSNVSKLALVVLMEHLHQHGIDWLDIQMVSPTLEKLGGTNISRLEFMNLLRVSLSKL